MDSLSLTLILLAAFVHVLPHVLLKGVEERGAFVWWMLAVNVVLYAPVLLLGPVPNAAWPYILASGAVEAVYIFTLSRAYATGDVSVVYPLARGSSPMFLLAFATLVLREPITIAGVVGVALIAIGILLGARMRWNGWALLSGAAIATYTTIDKAASPLVHPLPYIYLVLLVNLLIYTPFMRMETIRATWNAARWRIVIAAATAPMAYVLVLTAMRRGALASYAGAIREVSVVVAAIAGVVIFRERAGIERVIGAIVIVAGVVVIALRG